MGVSLLPDRAADPPLVRRYDEAVMGGLAWRSHAPSSVQRVPTLAPAVPGPAARRVRTRRSSYVLRVSPLNDSLLRTHRTSPSTAAQPLSKLPETVFALQCLVNAARMHRTPGTFVS